MQDQPAPLIERDRDRRSDDEDRCIVQRDTGNRLDKDFGAGRYQETDDPGDFDQERGRGGLPVRPDQDRAVQNSGNAAKPDIYIGVFAAVVLNTAVQWDIRLHAQTGYPIISGFTDRYRRGHAHPAGDRMSDRAKRQDAGPVVDVNSVT
ncbi:MAG: hypothetical protein ABIV36_18555, partial [Sphingobium limneticum]